MFTVKFANLEVGVSKSHSASMLQAGYWISALVASIIHSSHALATLHSMFYDGKHKIFGEICFLHALLAGHRSLTGDHFSWARSVCTVTEGVMDWFCRINIVKFWKAWPRPRTYIFLRRVALEQRSTGWIHTESVISCSNCLHSSDGESPWNSHILIFSIPRPCIIMETFHWSNGEIKRKWEILNNNFTAEKM